ncbi:MAG: GAF domain-containing protein, partial [Candidatus Eremiobacteraeota bacterium]|nr:GAF domain-containing protein [Candidatus Eremiobacteraeota bacterium]
IKLRSAVDLLQDSTRDLRQVLDAVTELSQNWTGALVILESRLETGKDVETKLDMISRFCLDRMNEARVFMAQNGEGFRISLWWFDDKEASLQLLLSNEIVDQGTLDTKFAVGEGLLGQAFAEDRVWNLNNAPAEPYYKKTRDNPSYRGLLLVPIREGREPVGQIPVGMLAIDREKPEYFDTAIENVACSLSHVVGFALLYADDEANLRGSTQ